MISVRTLSIATVGAGFIALGAMSSAQAATLLLDTFTSKFDQGVRNQGWWSATVPNSDKNDSYFVGEYSSGKPVRNFFTFDISALKNEPPVESLTLELQRYKGVGNKNLTIQLFGVSTPAKTLNNNSGKSRTIYNDLGRGRFYGEKTISTGGNSSGTLSFSLEPSAVVDINTVINKDSGRFFSIGGTLTPASLRSDGRQALFSSSDGKGVQRLEAIPEPSLVLGVLGFGAYGINSMLKRRQTIRK